MSMSSASSHEAEQDYLLARNRHQSLGLVPLGPSEMPDFMTSSGTTGDAEHGHDASDPVFVWTSTSSYGKRMRIGQQKKISRLWLDTYALKQYVDLNLTAFEKILKK